MDWLRLWHDMPTDPKFKTVSKISKQPLAAVIAVYVFYLVDASSNKVKRGVTHCNAENVASALDLETEQVEAIKKAMEGRLFEGNLLLGWEKRQREREDDSLERVRKYRDLKRQKENLQDSVTHCNALKRNVTHCNAPDTDTDTDTEEPKALAKAKAMSGKPDDDPLKIKNSEFKKQAKDILNFLNEKTGNNYRHVDNNLNRIIAKLKSGVSVDDCMYVIANRVREWGKDPKMKDYLRPATIFGAEKFEQYLGRLIKQPETGETKDE